MTSPRQARRIAIAGASGNIGGVTLKALLAHGIHDITVIARPESKSSFPSGLTIRKGAFDDEDFLAETLKGHDVLVMQLSIEAAPQEDHFIKAAAKAGVQWVLPTEFGSDPYAEELMKRFDFLQQKREKRRLVEKLGVSSWVAVVSNPWYDFCMAMGIWGIDLAKRRATLYDGGRYKISTTTLQRAGDATAELLALPDAELNKYRNGVYYITSFHVTQREMLDSALRATGTSEADWDISDISAAESLKKSEEKIKASGGQDREAFATMFIITHFLPGLGGDINDKVEDLTRFGLAKEDIDDVTRKVLKQLETKV